MMFQKLVVLTLVMVFLAGTLLVLRQQRMELSNQTAALYSEIQKHNYAIWKVESKAANLLRPEELAKRVAKAKLQLVPLTPEPVLSPRRHVASADSSRRTP